MSNARHASKAGSRVLVFAQERAAALWMLAAISGGGCADSGGDRAVVARYALERVSSCEEAEGALRARVLDEMNVQIDSLKESARGRPYSPCPAASYPSTYPSSQSYGESRPSASQAASAPMPSPPQPGAAPGSVPGASPSAPSASAPSSSAPSSSAPSSSAPARASSAPASPSSTPATPLTPATPAAGDSSTAASSAAKSTSTTNNQVFGVDEADFIKNDSKYVYAALNGALRIVEAWPAEQAREVARVALPGVPKKLFVTQDRALVYISMPPGALGFNPNTPSSSASFSYRTTPECTYGYGCEFGGDGTATVILVFDISDRTKPKQIRRLELSGSLLAARRIGDAVHTVVVTPEVTFSGLSYVVAGASSTCGRAIAREELQRQYEELRAKNAEIIAKAPLRQLIPSVREDSVEYADQVCGTIYRETVPTGTAFTSLVSLDMVAGGAPAISTIVSRPGAVYASGEALYMGVNLTENQSSTLDVVHPELATAIHKFEIGPTPVSEYAASGRVKGHVLNQFSMDEYEGHLRVATSWGKVPSWDVHSTLSVLAQRDLELTTVGVVDDIAPNEDIRSVRFEGERGFVVTFKKTDPLFAFDLSNPRKPRLAGELKIPGFSTYMHLLDSTHLLTIGYDAADQGSFAYFTGVLLQIFDVHDLAKPTLAHKTLIGTRGTSSEALTNHLAFNLWQDKLAVPMAICEGGGTNGMYGNDMTFSGLIVYDVSTATGLTERGRVAHPGVNGTYNSAGCNNWWTNASSNVERSIFMDDFVYSIARDVMRVQDLEAMGTDVASVSFLP